MEYTKHQWEINAEIYYSEHALYKKALSAGIAMDNALRVNYTRGGTTNSHFMNDNWLKYFEYSKLDQNNVVDKIIDLNLTSKIYKKIRNKYGYI